MKARQLILNLYAPGTGISAHIDLPTRFSDGILALSLGSGCAMNFVRGSEQHALWLPPNSALVLSGEARWEWSHGIAARAGDWVCDASGEDDDDLWGSDEEGEQRAWPLSAFTCASVLTLRQQTQPQAPPMCHAAAA
jgi:hypothetical protein